MFFFKDGKVISVEQGFRWATFKVDSDERPLTDEELRNEDGYELSCIANDECWEMWDMIDGCWCEIQAESDSTTDDDVSEFETAWEEESYDGVENLGWRNDDTEYAYYGPLELTNEDTGEVFKGEPDENVSVSGVPVTSDNLDWSPLPEDDTPVTTDWFPVSINPVREGSYQAMDSEVETKWPFSSNIYEAKWDGKKWDKEIVMWRGLNKDPNEV